MSKLVSTVEAYSENPTKTIVKARNFQMVIDEPANIGGTDEGPTPVEFVLGALSGCLNVVGHVIAKEMGFELKGITFELEGELDPSKFTGKETTERAGFQQIQVKVKPDAEADPETLSKWLKAVEERCPVSDNLINTTPVTIDLAN